MSVFFYFKWHAHEDKDPANVNSATIHLLIPILTTFQKDNCAKQVFHRTEKEKIAVYFCEVRANNLKNNSVFPRRIKRSPVKFSLKLEKIVLDSFGSQAGDIDQKSRRSFGFLSILVYYQINESNCRTISLFNHFAF